MGGFRFYSRLSFLLWAGLFFLFGLSLTSFGAQTDLSGINTQSLSHFSYTVTGFSPGISIQKDFQGDFIPYSGARFNKTDTSNRMIILKGEFQIKEALADKPLALYFGPTDYPYAVYFNHKLLFRRGTVAPAYHSIFFTSIDFPIPEDDIRPNGQPNEMIIELYPLYETAPFELPVIATTEKASQLVFFRDLFNVHLIQGACLTALLIGFYFLFRWVMRRFQDPQYFYFAMLCISFAFSYFNIFFNNASSQELLNEKITRSCFALDMLFISYFIREFTQITFRKIWITLLLGFFTFAAVGITWTFSSKEGVTHFFSQITSNFIITPLLIFNIVILIMSFIKHKRKAPVFMLFSFIFIAICSLHDLKYFSLGASPFCWLVPYSYLALLITIFGVLGIEESQLFQELQRRSVQIQDKNSSLKTVMNKIDQVSQNLVHSGAGLEENIEKAIGVVNEFRNNNQLISQKLLKEFAGIDQLAKEIAQRIEQSGERIPKAIASQTKVVQNTNASVENLYSQIEKIMDSSEKTNTVAQELSSTASDSKEIILKSKESMSRIAEYSGVISDMMKQIDNISEDSKFLSVNASIEAARAGIAGQGFSVVANEIRELAARSKQSSDESQITIKQMRELINQGLAQSEEVTAHLLTIIEKAGTSAKMIGGISEMISRQKNESKAIQEGARSLLTDTLSIQKLSDEENQENHIIKQTLAGLKNSFEDITALLQTQSAYEETIQAAIELIQNGFTENKNNNAILEETMTLAESKMD